jgi:hypothetical protein
VSGQSVHLSKRLRQIRRRLKSAEIDVTQEALDQSLRSIGQLKSACQMREYRVPWIALCRGRHRNLLKGLLNESHVGRGRRINSLVLKVDDLGDKGQDVHASIRVGRLWNGVDDPSVAQRGAIRGTR